MKTNIYTIIAIAMTCTVQQSQAQSSGCEQIMGGYPTDYDCFNCQFLRDEHNVWDLDEPIIHTHEDRVADGPGSVIYHCTEGTTRSSMSVSVSVNTTETLIFSTTGGGGGRVGLSMGLVLEGSFGLTATSANRSSVAGTANASITQNNVEACEGIGIKTEYKRFSRTGSIRIFGQVSHYLCNCVVDDGYLFEGVNVTYQCYPTFVNGRSDLVRTVAGAWVIAESYNPPRAPSSQSPSGCAHCSTSGGDDDDEPCGCSDDLDPDGDEDGDGKRNGDDDRPYGYDGDDPFGDDDGDGYANWEDATPYGYDGDDPYGDDDGDGIQNSMDPTPNGGTILPPVIFTPPFTLPIELRLE